MPEETAGAVSPRRMHPQDLAAALVAANALLRSHPLAVARVIAATSDALVLTVQHDEWPPPHMPPFGYLHFVEPTYVQMPLAFDTGATLHLFAGDVGKHLPSLRTLAADQHVFMWRDDDDAETPPSFVVAAELRVELERRTPG